MMNVLLALLMLVLEIQFKPYYFTSTNMFHTTCNVSLVLVALLNLPSQAWHSIGVEPNRQSERIEENSLYNTWIVMNVASEVALCMPFALFISLKFQQICTTGTQQRVKAAYRNMKAKCWRGEGT